jgi:hypothetical protein
MQKEPNGMHTDLGWSINYGHEFFEMTAKKVIEEDQILLLETLQEGVLAQRRVAGQELIICSPTLVIKVIDLVRETPDDTQLLALPHGKGGAFIPAGIHENRFTAEGDTNDFIARHVRGRRG